MDKVIKPIETIYNGYRFRSRLEARWAVFFDALGVDYEYEPEGFDLGDGLYYLPDFRVKCYGTRGSCDCEPFDLWIEVKGKMNQVDATKILRFSCGPEMDPCMYMIENPILVVGNIPKCSEPHHAYLLDTSYEFGIEYYSYLTIDGDSFGAYPAADWRGHFYLWGADCNYINSEDVQKVFNAYQKARQARFEHGESPNA